MIVIASTIKLTISQLLSQAATTRILRLLPLLPLVLVFRSPASLLCRTSALVRMCWRVSAIRMVHGRGYCRALA